MEHVIDVASSEEEDNCKNKDNQTPIDIDLIFSSDEEDCCITGITIPSPIAMVPKPKIVANSSDTSVTSNRAIVSSVQRPGTVSSDEDDCRITAISIRDRVDVSPKTNVVAASPDINVNRTIVRRALRLGFVSSDDEDCYITATRTANSNDEFVTTLPSTTVTLSPIKCASIASRPANRISSINIADIVTSPAASIERSNASDAPIPYTSLPANDYAIPLDHSDGTGGPAQDRQRIDDEQSTTRTPYEDLIEACKAVETSKEMTKVVAKIEKHYQQADADYVNSGTFQKLVKNLASGIRTRPTSVYIIIANLLKELKKQRKMVGDPLSDNKKAESIRRLNEALQKLQNKIRQNEEAEVDLDDELNSNYLLHDGLKQRAVQIYAKMCHLTGASRSAQRIARKPIKFQGTNHHEFNQALEKFVNKKNVFPDIFDVQQIMGRCNAEYNYQLSATERRDIAENAFTQIGILLQKRRKRDWSETMEYYSSDQTDPASKDPILNSQLVDNHRRFGCRLNEIIDKYSKRQRADESNEEEEDDAISTSSSNS